MLGRPFQPLGRKQRRVRRPQRTGPQQRRTYVRRTPRYEQVRAAVERILAGLGAEDLALIPLAGTLPEILTALALLWLKIPFQPQVGERGGRLRLGGSVVDFKVFLGATTVIVRVQGDYWHSLPSRKDKDLVQYEILHRMGFLVADLWEHDLYQAFLEDRLAPFVRQAVLNAT